MLVPRESRRNPGTWRARALLTGLSSAAKPTAGSWSGKHTHFTVNAAMTRITGWSSKCTGFPLPLKMKVKSNGTFSYKPRSR